MKFHVLTLFPDMIMQGLDTSIIGRAIDKKILELNAVNIRDYTQDRHGKVDDYTYGGGAGMLMQAQPVFDAWKSVAGSRTIYVTPQGTPFNQKMAQEFAREEELVLLCGHYEGIDERVLEEIVTDYVSIGDYVLTGGELAAMVMIDAIARLVPGVLHNEISADTESFHNDLLEYPQFSRPQIWHDKKVPDVLMSGNHTQIEAWRLEQAKERTKRIRPDLYDRYCKKQEVIKKLAKQKRRNIHMMESLRRGTGEVLFAEQNNVMIYDRKGRTCMLTLEENYDTERLDRLLHRVPGETEYFVVMQEELLLPVAQCFGFGVLNQCVQWCYTSREPLLVKHKDIRILSVDDLDYVCSRYTADGAEYVRRHILSKALYGAYVEDKLVGFAGFHAEGSLGFLYVEEAYRGQGIGASLESYGINTLRASGFTPYCNVEVGNENSLGLQEKLGLYPADNTLWWMGKASEK